MSQAVAEGSRSAAVVGGAGGDGELLSVRYPGLMRELLKLAAPVLAEHVLHIFVGLNDTYLANHLPKNNVEAATAVGNIGYIFWFLGLFAGAIATGSTAIIAREIGARHRRRANSAVGQSMLFAAMVGLALGVVALFLARPIVATMGLSGVADKFAYDYLRLLAPAAPFVIVMFVANACLRGAGDTRTPAIAMIIVDIVNVIFSWGLTWGWWGMPAMGFNGIAVGTLIAYIAGGVIQVCVLLAGRGGIQLHLHRLRPHWDDMRRIVRIGLPAGITDAVNWGANFALVQVVNRTPPINIASAAHINAVRIESLSYMTGFAVSIAVATMVGQSLGMKDPRRAARSAYLGFAAGGGFMLLMGLMFILFGHALAAAMVTDPEVLRLTARCLQITGFCQFAFASAIVFGGALRGAGDTLAVMLITMVTMLVIRFGGVMVLAHYRQPLPVIWVLLASDLTIRGIIIYGRFLHGGWKKIRV